MRIKVGDFVEVTGGNNHHNFPIGSIVEVKFVGSTGIKCAGTIGRQLKEQIILNGNFMKKNRVSTADILAVARKLAIANNTVTTLEIKAELRKKFKVNQQEVSDAMNDAYLNGEFIFTDNGTYRIYSLANSPIPTKKVNKTVVSTGRRGLVKGSAVALAAGKKAAATRAARKNGVAVANVVKKTSTSKTKYISRTKALELMANSKGSFFTVEFVEKDGSARTLNGSFAKNQKQAHLGYVSVRENNKLKAGVNPFRQVNLQTLQSLTINGICNKVR